MNRTARNLGLIALAAGILYYPVMRLIRNMIQRPDEHDGLPDHRTEHHIYKIFAPTYRGAARPHRRK